jgi:hypothetical protein
MKRKLLLTSAMPLIGLVLFAALPAAAFGAQCSLASATGNWAFSYIGSVYSTEGNSFVPAGMIGTITFDGKGGATGSDSLSVAGKTMDETFSGTYTENADCSGTFALTSEQSKQTVTGRFIQSKRDKEANLILTSPGMTMTGTAKRVSQ